MKKCFNVGAKALALLASAFLLFGTVACSSDDSEEGSPVIQSSQPSEESESQGKDLGTSFEFSGYKWNLVKATKAVEKDGVLTVSQSEIGVTMQLDDSELPALYAAYPKGFAVTAVVRPTEIKSLTGDKLTSQGKGDSGADFALVSHIGKTAAGADSWYSFSINTNGRTQLGDAWKMKGRQFGSLLTDPSGKIFKGVIDEPYIVRLEYNADGTTSGRINGIRQAQNGESKYTPQTDAKVTRSATNGSFGFVNDKVPTFELYSFKVHALDKGYETINLKTTNSDIAILKDGFTDAEGGSYVFLRNCAYTTKVGKDAEVFTVSAKNDAGEDALASVTMTNSDSSVAEAVLADGSLSINPVAVGNAVVTLTNGDTKRTITVTVEEAASYIDTDYASESAFYPLSGATGIYEDDHLKLTFDDVPELGEGDIEIYEESNLTEPVCKIRVDGAVTNTITDGKISNLYTLKYFMVQVVDKTVEIIPTWNSLENGKTYVVGMANGVITGKINGKDFTGFAPENKRWSFSIRESKPTVTSEIKVGSSSDADFRSVQGALQALSADTVITVEKGTYREILRYGKDYNVTIKGDTTTEYGTDVVIVGINCNEYNGSTNIRGVFSWLSGKNLTFMNVTLQNAMDRNTMISGGSAQSEALYFNGDKLVAYNSSFKGFQDTLLINHGRAWFYKCYVEGDTDFIWGSADVALFEECKVVQLDTSKDTKKTSGSYVFETRVSNEENATVGKGFVLFNSTLDSKHANSYLARRASAKNASGNYYDQSAFINVNETGTLQGALYVGNEPVYLEKADGNQHVGIKYYNDGSKGNIDGSLFTKDWEGTITETVYKAEYSGRNVILNRVYKKTGKYVNADSIWDISSLESDFNCSADEGPAIVESEVEGANGTYDICALGQAATEGASSWTQSTNQGSAFTDGTSEDGYLSWRNLQYHSGSSSYGAQTSKISGSETVITIYVAGASVVTWTGSSYSAGKLTVTDSDNNIIVDGVSTKTASDKISQGFLYTGTTATTLTLSFNAAVTYINNIVVKVLDDETNAVSAITLGGSTTLAVGNTSTLTATVTRSYLSTNDSVTWSSEKEDVATVDSNGTVTAKAAGTATIKATSVATPSVSQTIDVTVNATAATAEVGSIYTWNFVGLSAVPSTVGDSENNGINLTIAATTDGSSLSNNSGYGLYGTEATYSFPVAGDATIIAYATYLNGSSATLSLATDDGTVVGTDQTLTLTDTLWGEAKDHKPANGPVAYVWRYTGNADTLVLTVPAKVYMGQIVADNTASETALTACSYDFTASDMATPLAPSAGSNKMHWYGSATAAYKDSNYGIQTLGPTFFTFYVGGACTITFTDTYDQAGSAVYLYEEGSSTTVDSVTTSKASSSATYSVKYTGTSATVLRLQVPKNVYISTIAVAASE